jgi:hypothetical protein
VQLFLNNVYSFCNEREQRPFVTDVRDDLLGKIIIVFGWRGQRHDGTFYHKVWSDLAGTPAQRSIFSVFLKLAIGLGGVARTPLSM